MLQGVGIEYRPGGESGRTYYSRSTADHYEMSDRQKEGLVEIFTEAFQKELGRSEHFTIVTESGPDVLLIRGGLLDVISLVPSDQMGRGEVFVSRVGEATLVLEIRDSVSDAILARAVDRRAAEDASGRMTRSNRVTNASEVRQMAQTWARKLRMRLDEYAIK